MSIIETDRFLAQYKEVLQNALDGRYAKAEDMRRDLLAASSRRVAAHYEVKTAAAAPNRRSGRRAAKRRKTGRVAETVLIAVLLLGAYGFYIYWHLSM